MPSPCTPFDSLTPMWRGRGLEWARGLLGRGGIALALAGCLFDGEETRGLACTNDRHCGVGISCIEGVCGGIDACSSGKPRCVDDEVLQVCHGGTPAETKCDDVCSNLGFGRALTCAHSPADDEGGCYCDKSSSFCDVEGARECWSEDDIRECVGGAWQNADCDSICALDGLGSGIGCGLDMDAKPACECAAPCEHDSQFCVDAGTAAYCDNAQWTQIECDQALCPGGVSLGCGFLQAIGDETCLCGA